jgi:hypothetical protein
VLINASSPTHCPGMSPYVNLFIKVICHPHDLKAPHAIVVAWATTLEGRGTSLQHAVGPVLNFHTGGLTFLACPPFTVTPTSTASTCRHAPSMT